MPNYATNTPKPKPQSKTVWGIVTTLLGALLATLGIAADPSFLSDGFQLAQDYIPLMGLITAIVGWAIKSYGQRTATQPLQVLLVLLLPLFAVQPAPAQAAQTSFGDWPLAAQASRYMTTVIAPHDVAQLESTYHMVHDADGAVTREFDRMWNMLSQRDTLAARIMVQAWAEADSLDQLIEDLTTAVEAAEAALDAKDQQISGLSAQLDVARDSTEQAWLAEAQQRDRADSLATVATGLHTQVDTLQLANAELQDTVDQYDAVSAAVRTLAARLLDAATE